MFRLIGQVSAEPFAGLGGSFARWEAAGRGYLAEIPASSVTGVESAPLAFQARVLANPAQTRARFQLALPRSGRVRMSVFDVAGHQVARLADGWRTAGWHDLKFEPLAASQLYLYRVEWEGNVLTGKFAVLR